MSDLYKGFKKVAEDQKRAFLKHDNGHELHIAKSGLSKKHLSALEKLPLYQAEGTQDVPETQSQVSPEEYQKLAQWSQEQKSSDVPVIEPKEMPMAKEEKPVAEEKPIEEEVPQTPSEKALTPGLVPQEMPRPQTLQDVLADPNAASSQKLMAANQWFQNVQKKQQEADQLFQSEMSKAAPQIPKMLSGQGFLGGLARVMGFLIGGGSQGVLGLKENPATTMFNDQINREIEAQRYEAAKKFNLYKLHMNRLGDESQAALQTGINLRQIANQQFDEMMGKTGLGPMAMQNLQVAKAQNQLALQQSQMALANMKFQTKMLQQAQAGVGGQDPASLVPRIVPEHHQEAVYKEIERAEDTRRMGESILNWFDKAAQQQTVLRTGAGLLRTSPAVLQLHQSLQPTFKDLEGTVRQAAMDNTFKNLTPAAGDTDATIAQKRQGLIQYLQSKASAPRAKSFGIDLDKFQSTSPIKNIEIKTMGGVKYQKVPGGWIKVK